MAIVLRGIVVRIRDEQVTVRRAGKLPVCVVPGVFEFRLAPHRLSVGEIGHRIVAADGQAQLPAQGRNGEQHCKR
jgi:hypothetical protein